MKTDFTHELKALAASFPLESKEREIMFNLATNCVGRENAIPLHELGTIFGVTGHWIQTHVIAPSRRCPAFLGTCSKGVFVINTEKDAQAMLDFYEERIEAETANRDRLINLIA